MKDLNRGPRTRFNWKLESDHGVHFVERVLDIQQDRTAGEKAPVEKALVSWFGEHPEAEKYTWERFSGEEWGITEKHDEVVAFRQRQEQTWAPSMIRSAPVIRSETQGTPSKTLAARQPLTSASADGEGTEVSSSVCSASVSVRQQKLPQQQVRQVHGSCGHID